MDSIFYQGILKDCLLPFLHEQFPQGDYRFIQDNDPKHVSRATKAWMLENDIRWWETPPESPDLNPIELVWHELKHYIRRHVKPMTKDELKNGILAFWAKMTPAKCEKYIGHMRKVIPAVVLRTGAASGF
jgi:hypothetical protein